jgi:hypothetical protein
VAENERAEWRARRGGLWPRAVRALQEATYGDLLRICRDRAYVAPCRASTRFATLWDDGRVGACEVLDFDAGNVRDAGLDLNALLQSDRVRSFRDEEILRKRCTCEWQCALSVNLLYQPSAIGRVLRAFVRPGKIRL